MVKMFGLGPKHGLVRARRVALGGVSLLLVIALGVAAVLSSGAASREAKTVHERDRIKGQQILSGLTAQYLKFAALELSQLGASQRWTLRPGDPADTAALRRLSASSPLFRYGAALVSLSGRPLAFAAQQPGLPPATDPGYAPLMAALHAGRFGVSDVMRVGSTPLVAIAVPIEAAGRPRALLLGYADARNWPLQVYSRHQVRFDPGALPYIVDGAGTIVAAGSPAAVGRTLPAALLGITGARARLIRYRAHRGSFVAFYDPTGIAGWRTLTIERAAAFSGALDERANAVGVTLIALLAAAIGGLIVLTLKREHALRRLADEALYDQLTGLASRRLFGVRLEAALAKQHRTRSHLGVLFSDLDGFKAINDRFGHATGDAALQEAARRLRAAVRAEDSVARLGGDEFIVLLEDIDVDALGRIAASLAEAIGEPLLAQGAPVELRASFGGVIVGPDATSAAAVMHAADLAMYEAKSTGRIEIRHYREDGAAPAQPAGVIELRGMRSTRG
jgi:diguanylate cyclase (GGDEF)-like protein